MRANAVATALGAASSQCLSGAFDRDLERSARPTELCSYPVEIISPRKKFGSSRDEETGARLAPPSDHFPCSHGEQYLGLRRDVLLCLITTVQDKSETAVLDGLSPSL